MTVFLLDHRLYFIAPANVLFPKVDSNHFRIDPYKLLLWLVDAEMWNDVFHCFRIPLSLCNEQKIATLAGGYFYIM